MRGSSLKKINIFVFVCILVLQAMVPSSMGLTWTESEQIDFEDGIIQNTSVSLSPGNVTLVQTQGQNWWENNWTYRIPINITENSGTTLEDFQVLVEPYTSSLIAEGKMRPDMGDIRFTDSNGNLLPHWIESNDYVANWRFDEGNGIKTYDDSRYRNHGTWNGWSVPNWTDGKYGYALDFDGSNDYVDFSNPCWTHSQGTIMAWINTSSTGAGQIVSISDGDMTTNYLQFYTVNEGGPDQLGLQINDGVVTQHYADYSLDGQWHYVALTQNGTELKMYIDGVQTAVTNASSEKWLYNFTGLSHYRIGNTRHGGINKNHFTGKIDEVRIYDRALSQEEINATYYGKSRIWVNVPSIPASSTTPIYMYYGNPGALDTSDFDNTFTKDFGESGLVGLWHMDEGSGLTAVDSSGNGNDGTWNGFVNGNWTEMDGGQWGGRSDVRFSKGSALEFDGVDDYINTNPDFSPSSLTISAWVKGNNYDSTGYNMVVSDQSSYYLTVKDSKVTFRYYNGSTGPWREISGPTALIPGMWYYLSATFNEATFTGSIYVNGVLEGSDTAPGFLIFGGEELTIGTDQVGGSLRFNGIIDEVRVYDRSLNSEEINAQYERHIYASIEPTYNLGQEEIGYWQVEGLWKYRTPIVINNSGNQDNLTYYQVQIELNTSLSISGGKMKMDVGDIRFATSSGIEIQYWIESGINTNQTKIWLKVPTIPANGGTTVYMYYGNSNVKSASSGYETFEFFDDFEDEVIEDTPSKWNVIEQNCEIRVTDVDSNTGRNSLRIKDTGTQTIVTHAKRSFSPQSMVALDIAARIQNITYSVIGLDNDTIPQIIQNHSHAQITIGNNNQKIYYSSPDPSPWTEIEDDDLEWHNYTIAVNMTHYIKILKDGIIKVNDTPLHLEPSNDWQNIILKPLDGGFSTIYDNYYDNVRIRKYSSPEPIVTLGLEEGRYPNFGTYISSINNTGSNGTIWNTISWIEFLPPDTDITISTRTGNTSTPDGTWSNWSDEVTDNLSSPITSPRARNIQYRVTFTTSNGSVTPILSEVIIDYTLNSISIPSLSAPLDNSWLYDNTPTFSWIHNDPNMDAQMGFIVEVDDVPSFGSPNYTDENISSSSEFWTPITPLPDGTWHWRVRTRDEYGLWSNWSENWTINIDIIAPEIILNSPINNSVIPDGTPLDFNIIETNLDYANYSINGGMDTPISNPFDIPTAGWIDGVYTILITALDLAGNFNFSWYLFTIDSTAPSIMLNSPINNSVVPSGTVLDFLVTDQNFDYANYSVNGGIYTPLPNPFDIPTTGWTDDDYYINVVAYDQAGNIEFMWFHFVIDSTLPAIVLNTPFNNSVVQEGTVLDFSITDTNILDVNYTINGAPEVPFVDPYNIPTAGWLDGDYTIVIDALDEAGNFNSSWYFFTIDSTNPIISLVSPGNNTIITPGTSLDYSIIENNLLKANYSINGGPDNPIIDPYDIDTTGWADGGYTIVINAEDMAGNVNSSWFFFTISSAPPSFDSGTEDFISYTGDTFIIYGNFTDNTDVTSVTIYYRNEAGSWTSMTMTKDFDAGPGGVDRFSISSADLGIMTWNDESDWHFYFEASDGVLTSTHGDAGNYFVITVIDNLGPDADAGPDQIVDEDTIVNVNAGGSWDNIGIITYSWDWNAINGISLDNDTALAMHVYATPGIYIVTLNITDAEGNWDTDNLIITVRDLTSPVADAGSDIVVDEDVDISFDGSGSADNFAISSHFWDFDDSDGIGIDAEGSMANHVYSEPGIYTVTLNVTDASGNWDSTTILVTVLDITSPIANAGEDREIDEDTEIEFNASSSMDNSGTSGLTYSWDFDASDGIQIDGTGMISPHTYDSPGTYVVTLNVSDGAGNWAIDTVTVIVRDTTNPDADAGPDQIVDEDSIIMFDGTDSSDNDAIASYEWTFFDGDQVTLSGSQSYYRLDNPGVYIISLTVTDTSGNTNTDEMTVKVIDTTSPMGLAAKDIVTIQGADVSFDGSYYVDNNGTHQLSYKWTFEVNASPVTLNGKTQVYTFEDPGAYVVTLNVTDSAGNWDIDTIVVTVLPDADGDGSPDSEDEDDDNDGTPDTDDAFPFDEVEDKDTDNDATGNNADSDDDGDGTSDSEDEFPLDPTEWEDFDEDGTGDNKDLDDDGDGREDDRDYRPFDPQIQDPPIEPFPWWLLIIGLIIGLLLGFLLLKMRGQEEEEIPDDEAVGAIIEEEEPEPEDYEELEEDKGEPALIEEEEAEPGGEESEAVEQFECPECGAAVGASDTKCPNCGVELDEEVVDEEGIHEEPLGQDILNVWNEKYEAKGYLSTICPSCFEEAEFNVETTEAGKDFICPNCRAKYVYKEE